MAVSFAQSQSTSAKITFISMRKPRQRVKLLDYRQAQASQELVPQPAALSSLGWNDIHFELHQQPKFETLEHQHTMHVIALGFSHSPGERWLDGKIQTERRNRGDVALIPANITHRCNWNNSAEFGILAVEPALLKQVGQDLVDGDRIELIPLILLLGFPQKLLWLHLFTV